MYVVVYLFQIALLLVCIFMVWRSRAALNGLARGQILLLLILIIHSLDDAFGFLSDTARVILSTGVVLLVTFDLSYLYRQRQTFARYLQNRQARITDLEVQRERAEHSVSWDGQDIFKK